MNKIIAKDKEHLRDLIDQEIKRNGPNCDLNYIDVSNVTDMTCIFAYSRFNQDISGWNIINVKYIFGMFNSMTISMEF